MRLRCIGLCRLPSMTGDLTVALIPPCFEIATFLNTIPSIYQFR